MQAATPAAEAGWEGEGGDRRSMATHGTQDTRGTGSTLTQDTGRGYNAGYRVQDTGYRTQETRLRVQDTGYAEAEDTRRVEGDEGRGTAP